MRFVSFRRSQAGYHAAMAEIVDRRWKVARAWRVALLLAALALVGAAAQAAALDPLWFVGEGEAASVRLYFFHSNGCPHCRAARPVLRGIMAERPWLAVEWLEVGSEGNEQAFFQMAREFGREPEAVPTFFVCREMVVGFEGRETTGAHLAALADRCYDELRTQRSGSEAVARDPARSGSEAVAPDDQARSDDQTSTGTKQISLPLVGEVDAASLSLPVLTLVLGGLDAFNPCAFFVLLFLLSFLVHARSRGRMALVGGLFVAVSGVMYFLFMAAWLNLFLLLHNIGWITLAAGLVALVVGALGVKDYFCLGAGPSLSIPAGAKPSLYRRMGQIAGEQRLPVLLGATALLAITANTYELLCTSGFPMVYTSVLTQHDLSPAGRYGWLAAYNVVYVLPLLVIVGAFVVTLGARKLTEGEGRVLKLVSGLMMLGLGLILVLAPQLLSNVATAALLLGAAVGLAALIVRLRPAG
jgi:hypothetical protein